MWERSCITKQLYDPMWPSLVASASETFSRLPNAANTPTETLDSVPSQGGVTGGPTCIFCSISSPFPFKALTDRELCNIVREKDYIATLLKEQYEEKRTKLDEK